MKNELPIFETLNDYGFLEQLSEEDLKYILTGLFENNNVGKIRLTVDNFLGDKKFTVEKVNISDDERILDTNILYEEVLGDYFINYYDKNGNLLEYFNSNGEYSKFKYDRNGNRIYHEEPGGWVKYEYDDNGNQIYFENSIGYWRKREYDENGNIIYYEFSNGDWGKYKYDENGNQVYFENSAGLKIDKSPKK